jgi:glycosyltransferase involved in cell wall biosynthesis
MTAVRIVLATAFPGDPQSPRGGVEAVSVVLIRALAAEPSLDVHVVTADSHCKAPAISAWRGASIHRLPWGARRMLAGAVGADAKRLCAYVSGLGPDVVHAHDTYGIMLQALDLPRLLTIHGFIYADTLVSGERYARLRSRAWRSIETRAWARYPRIVSISPYVRERLSGIANGVIHDIDNPVAEEFFDVERREVAGRVFSAATISPRKNTLGLVEAFGRLAARGIDATLTLAGPQTLPAYADQVRGRIRDLALGDRVTLLPSISTPEVCRELSEASVAALVSIEENSPLTVQEAMAAGVPVVTSNRCGMPYQVTDGETGFLVHPLDTGEIAERLEQLLIDASLRHRLGARARTVARDRFHPATVARRTMEVYRRLTRQS